MSTKYCGKYEEELKNKYGLGKCKKLEEYMNGIHTCEYLPRLCKKTKNH